MLMQKSDAASFNKSKCLIIDNYTSKYVNKTCPNDYASYLYLNNFEV